MPIYEYECESCGETFEVFLSSHDTPVTKCEYCNSKKIRKLISNCSFQLKGTGWYVTDYANKDKNTGGKTKKKEAAKSSSTAESKEAPATSDNSTAEKKSTSAAENKAA